MGDGRDAARALLISDELVGSLPPIQQAPLGEAPLGEAPLAAALKRVPARAGDDLGLWRAIVEGDVAPLQAAARRGSLHGRLRDPVRGQSVLWAALACQQTEVALWLVKRFPAGAPGGVDLGETGPRGDSLPHLCLCLVDFDAQAAELLQLLLGPRSSPEHANERGQTFVHLAAARMNVWALRLLLRLEPVRALPVLLGARDDHGATPLQLLRRPATRPAPIGAAQESTRSWSPFCALLDVQPPFADLLLEIDTPVGIKSVQAHRVVLGANSEVLDTEIRRVAPGDALRLRHCQCLEVATDVLRFLYSGTLPDLQEPAKLWQLLRVCMHYQLPAQLAIFAKNALISGRSMLPEILQAADTLRLSAEERGFLADALLELCCADEPVTHGDSECLAAALACALAELEQALCGKPERSET